MQHIAIDLGSRESQICRRSANGEILDERVMKTTQLGSYFSRHEKCRVILETCAEAFKVADSAIEAGHDVRVVPATLVRTLGVGQRGIKTDRRDAQILSEVSCRIDLPSVHVRTHLARERKSIAAMRQVLIESRTQLINSVRGWLRTNLDSVRTGGAETFHKRVREKKGIPAFVERQLKAIEELTAQIKAADKDLNDAVEADPVCSRLKTVPGVGPVTVMAFVAAIDDVSRFPNAHQLESYLGLTAGERSSSMKQHRTGITKAGPAEVRRTMVQACWVIYHRRPQDPLSRWGQRVAARRGKNVAVVAMARKLAGILYAMWRDAADYDPEKVATMR